MRDLGFHHNPSAMRLGSTICGYSELGAPLTVFHLRGEGDCLRVFIIAGQHGDEPSAVAAASRFIEAAAQGLAPELQSFEIAVLSNANPDGSAQNTRRNARGVDLNRDHEILSSKETLSIHSFVRSWKPQVVVDLHNYPPRRKRLLARNLVYCHDILIDFVTNPAACLVNADNFTSSVTQALAGLGYEAARYALVRSSGGVRHSTPDVVDARNSIALRYGVPTVLIEGKSPKRKASPETQERAVSAQTAALFEALRRIRELIPSKNSASTDDSVPIRSRYVRSSEPCRMNFRIAKTNRVEEVAFINYTPALNITKTVCPPLAYAVPEGKIEALETLGRHGFSCFYLPSLSGLRVEGYFIESVNNSARPRRSPRSVSVSKRELCHSNGGFFIFPADGHGRGALCVYLEPESKYGIHRYKNLNLRIAEGEIYPILRVIG
ncbi:MAG: M14 family zinc carboxypeptidase [Deltaproteobacteria bacterium]